MLQLTAIDAAKSYLKTLRQGTAPAPAGDGPVADMILDHLRDGLEAYLKQRVGTLYLAAMPNIPNLYKVGYTRRSLETRIRSLRTAGALVSLVPIQSWKVFDAPYVEAQCHRQLSACRIEREFFQDDWRTLIQSIASVVETDQGQVRRGLVQLGMDAHAFLAPKHTTQSSVMVQRPHDATAAIAAVAYSSAA